MLTDPVERVRAALAEAGYPGAEVVECAGSGEGERAVTITRWSQRSIPLEVCWRAYRVAGTSGPCLECWTFSRSYDDARGCLLWDGENAVLARDCGRDRSS